MLIKFLGTRGEIEARTKLHGRHSALLLATDGKRVMVDCGLDWLEDFRALKPDAIVLTHAHPDHAWGLKNGAPCPVFATERTWSTLDPSCHVEEQITLPLRQPTNVCNIRFEAFALEHSLRCPAVGYKIVCDNHRFFYSPDVAYIPDRVEAFAGIEFYVGDGATITRSMVRRRGDSIFGHAPIRTQLTWCEKEQVPRAFFTHCGSEIVEADETKVAEEVSALGREKHVQAQVACDGMELNLN